MRSFAVRFHHRRVVMTRERIAIYIHPSDPDKVLATPDRTRRVCTHYVKTTFYGGRNIAVVTPDACFAMHCGSALFIGC